MNKIRIGIIGCSRIADSSVIPAIISSEFSELGILGSREMKRAKEFADKFDCKSLGTYEDVINDDDCLDGWFIVQRREYESSKNKREMEKRLGNSKIANSQEVYLMAGDSHTADKINNMNDVVGRGIIQNRNSQIENTGTMKHTQLSDVQQQIHAQRHQQAIQKIKGR